MGQVDNVIIRTPEGLGMINVYPDPKKVVVD